MLPKRLSGLKKCKRKAKNAGSGEFANMNPDKNTFKHYVEQDSVIISTKVDSIL